MLPSNRPSLLGCLGVLLLALAAGCTPKIGDKCVLSTDCSTQGTRLCDTSQPEGYCTQFNCRGNDCTSEAACVEFDSALPGCGFNDRSGPGGARTARTFCMAVCSTNSDCRDGYVCADPRQPPWNAFLMDNDQTSRTCMVRPIGWGEDAGFTPGPSGAPVCGPVAPDVPAIEAGAPSSADAGAGDAGADAADASDGG